MTESKMPARIWAHQPSPKGCVVSFTTPSTDYNVEFIRADLVEPLVEALRWALAEIDKQTTYQHPGQFLACDTKARAALSSYEAITAGHEAEARE